MGDEGLDNISKTHGKQLWIDRLAQKLAQFKVASLLEVQGDDDRATLFAIAAGKIERPELSSKESEGRSISGGKETQKRRPSWSNQPRQLRPRPSRFGQASRSHAAAVNFPPGSSRSEVTTDRLQIDERRRVRKWGAKKWALRDAGRIGSVVIF